MRSIRTGILIGILLLLSMFSSASWANSSNLWSMPDASLINNPNSSVGILASISDPIVSDELGVPTESPEMLLPKILHYFDLILLTGTVILLNTLN